VLPLVSEGFRSKISRQTTVQQPGLKLRNRVFSEREAQHPSFTDINLFSSVFQYLITFF
jgi:hypothetical protein